MLDDYVMLQTKEGSQLGINASICMLPVRELCSAHLHLLNLISPIDKISACHVYMLANRR
jgi:hypothetical protein